MPPKKISGKDFAAALKATEGMTGWEAIDAMNAMFGIPPKKRRKPKTAVSEETTV